jgi:carbonic anhydrase/acetyltransferase-like protein (isoleucine patch superfamily)
MPIYELDGDRPDIHPSVFIAPDAQIIGKVRLAKGTSVWFGAVLRGDTEWIEVGEGSNIQDLSVLHTDAGFPLKVGKDCTIGHKAILHGCTVEDLSLVGMGATVLNGAIIRSKSIIGANALVSEKKEITDYSLAVGVPAKIVKTFEPSIEDMLVRSARHYQSNAARFLNGLKRID